MTIIAGFKSFEGIVLCADTQETVGAMKRNVPKLRFEPSEGWVGENNNDALAVAFCGAGDGPFIDNLVEGCWQSAKTSDSVDQACERIREHIERQYQKFGRIYQQGYCPSVELIFGATMYGESKLFSADGPIVNEVEGYCSNGIGRYIADFLASRMYGNHLTVHQCVILAAYILFQAKEHVHGCGGDSHIAVLREEGASGLVDTTRVRAMTAFLRSSDSEVGRLLLKSANLGVTDIEFRETFETTKEVLETLRENQRNEIAKWDRIGDILGGKTSDRDSLGFMRSDAQTSEPEG